MSSKVSDMVVAAGANPADLLYLVQSLADKQITIQNLFANLPVSIGTSSFLQLTGTPEIVTSGAVSVVTPLSNIALNGATTLTIAAGIQGQYKVLTAISGSASSAVINANIANTSITFNKPGDSATLLYNSGKWYFVGGSATVV